MSFFGRQPSGQPTTKNVANISGNDVSTNQEAIPVPYLAGIGKIALEWIAPVYNPKAVAVKTGGSKFTSATTTGYKYFGDVAGLVCFGPVDVIYMIIIDNNIAWPNVPNIKAGFATGGLFRGSAAYETITIPKYGVCRIYWGTEAQVVDDLILTPRGAPPGTPGFNPRDPKTWPNTPAAGGQQTFDQLASGDANPLQGHYDVHPAYLGMCYLVFKQLSFGQGMNAAPNVEVIVGRATSWFANTRTTLDLAGVQPIGPLYEALTNGRYGGEFTDAQLGQSTFEAAATALSTFVLSPLITQRTKHREFLAQLIQYFDGWLRRNGSTIEAGLFAHGNVDTAGLPHLASDDLTAEPDLKSTGFGGTFNYFSVIYNNRHRYFKQDVERYTDESNREAVGETRTTEAQLPWIADPQIAQQYAVEWGQIQSLPVTTGSISVKRERMIALGINVGSRFFLDSAALNFSMVMRCLEIEWPKDKDGSVKVNIESERGLWPAIYYPPAAAKDQDFNFGPQPIDHYRIIELPLALRDDPSVTEISVLALRPNIQIIGFRVWESLDGTTYTEVSPENSFAAFGKLDTDYSAATSNPDTTTGLSIYLYGVGLDQVIAQSDQARDDGTLLLFIDDEIMSVGLVTALGDGLFNVQVRRGLYGTALAAHTADAEVWFIHRAAIAPIKSVDFMAGNTVHFKLQSHTQTLDDDLAGETPIDYLFGTPVTHAAPAISPSTQSFETSLAISLSIEAGLVARFTLDGSAVTPTSPEWPKASGSYTTLAIAASCILHVRGYAPDGSRTEQVTGAYILVAAGAGGTPPTGPVTFSFSGTHGHTPGNLTLNDATSGAAIHYRINGGSWTAYTAPVAINVNDIVDAYATHSGMTDSAETTFDNSGTAPICAQPTFSFSGTQHSTSGNLTLSDTTSGATIHYRINGGSWTAYSAPVAIALDDVIDAYASASGYSDSPQSTFDNAAICATPTFTWTGNLNLQTVHVTLHCATGGATIHYRFDGRGSWLTYTSGTLTLAQAHDLEAYASAGGYADSAIDDLFNDSPY